MKIKIKRILTALLSISILTIGVITPSFALSVGDTIGQIYSTDILAYVDGAPIRSFALDGKTAIVVEDLQRYGFVTGYDDYNRTLYAYVKTNTYEPQPDEGITRGVVGDVVGDIYYSDIKTYINGVLVPSFTLNGVTAVAIEDIGADETQNQTSNTCMMYKWDNDTRSISLNPVYDNTDKVVGGFFGIIDSSYPMPKVTDGILTFDENTSCTYGAHMTATLPSGAYGYPIHWKTADGPIIAKAYESAMTAPDQSQTISPSIKTYTRYIMEWDFEAVSKCLNAESFEGDDFSTVLERETSVFTALGIEPQKYENNSQVLLVGGNRAVTIQRSYPYSVCHCDEWVPGASAVNQVVIKKPDMQSMNILEVANGENDTYTLSGSYDGQDFIMNVGSTSYTESPQIFFPKKENTKYGDVYALSTNGQSITNRNLAIDGVDVGSVRVINSDYADYICVADFINVIGGSLKTDGLVFDMTTNGSEYSYRFDYTGQASYEGVTVSQLNTDYYCPIFNVNGVPFKLVVKRPSMSMMGSGSSTLTFNTSPILYDGELYLALESLPMFKAQN